MLAVCFNSEYYEQFPHQNHDTFLSKVSWFIPWYKDEPCSILFGFVSWVDLRGILQQKGAFKIRGWTRNLNYEFNSEFRALGCFLVIFIRGKTTFILVVNSAFISSGNFLKIQGKHDLHLFAAHEPGTWSPLFIISQINRTKNTRNRQRKSRVISKFMIHSLLIHKHFKRRWLIVSGSFRQLGLVPVAMWMSQHCGHR